MREECSIEVAVGPLLGVFEPIVRDDDGRIRYHYVVIDYLALYVSGDVAAGDDAAELRWVPVDELGGYELLPATREMIERGRASATTGSALQGAHSGENLVSTRTGRRKPDDRRCGVRSPGGPGRRACGP